MLVQGYKCCRLLGTPGLWIVGFFLACHVYCDTWHSFPSFPRTRDINTCRVFDRGTITTCFDDICLSYAELKPWHARQTRALPNEPLRRMQHENHIIFPRVRSTLLIQHCFHSVHVECKEFNTISISNILYKGLFWPQIRDKCIPLI